MAKAPSRRDSRADNLAAESLILSYYQQIYSYLFRLCACRELAEDLTQETFMKAWQNLDGFQQRCSVSTWLYRIAYNRYVDSQRKGKLPVVSQVQWWDIADETSGPVDSVADSQESARIYRLIEQLDDDSRQLIHLHYYEKLSLAETASILNIPLSTLKYRLRKTLDKLKYQVDSDS